MKTLTTKFYLGITMIKKGRESEEAQHLKWISYQK